MSNDEPLFDSDVDPKRIKNVADGLRRQGEFESARMLDSYAVMLAAAPQQAAEPVAVTDEMVERALMREFLEHVLRTAQPAQDAKCPHVITSGEGTSHCRLAEQDTKDAARYRWLRDSADSYTWDYLGGIGADRVDAAVDAAMAKESGR